MIIQLKLVLLCLFIMGGGTIDDTLNSLVNQILSDVEILLVNDGSTDNTDDICRKYNNICSNITYISTENGGVSAARNIGLERAKGEYVTFVDGDDILVSRWREIVSKEMMTSSDLYIFNVYNESAKRKVMLVNRNLGDGLVEDLSELDYFWAMDFIPGVWDKIFKRSIIEEYGIRFDETMQSGEDNLFVKKYLDHINSCYISNNAYYIYKYNSNSVSNSSLFKSYSDFHKVIVKRMECSDNMCGYQVNNVRNAIVRSLLNRFLWSIKYFDMDVCVKDYQTLDYKYGISEKCVPKTMNQKLNLVIYKLILREVVPKKCLALIYGLKKSVIETRR